MWNRFLPLFLSLFLLLSLNCSEEASTTGEAPSIELVQASGVVALESKEEEKKEEELAEDMEFPIVQEVYVYDAGDRRDPFLPLLVGEGEELPEGGRKINVENLTLVGILWGDLQKIAVLSDQAGNGYVFKAGDTLPGGKVVSVGENSIVFELSQFGIVTKYEIVMEE